MRFNVTIKETLERTFQVEADSREAAESAAHHLYRNCDIVLSADDFKGTEFLIEKPFEYFKSADKDFTLLHGDSRELLPSFDFRFDMIFADPPYFLSNGGISLQSGKVVSVNKGDWDKSQGLEADTQFYLDWITACREKLEENGTIWISSTYHNVGLITNCLQRLGFKILNVITWQKTNPPQNISCRCFTYSTEFVVWARKSQKKPHYFDYELMKSLNGGHQMTDVWRLPAIAPWEKSCTKHPTQKPLSLLTRIIQASTKERDWILDPFTGSSTTGIAANLLNRRFLGIDIMQNYLDISVARKHEIEDQMAAGAYRKKIAKVNEKDRVLASSAFDVACVHEDEAIYGYKERDLPF